MPKTTNAEKRHARYLADLAKHTPKYLMQSRLGQRVNVWNLKTLQHHMRMLFAVLQSACNHPIHTIFAICIELNNFVRRGLVESQRTIAAVEQRSTP
jgi:hypothetical protein